MFYETMVFEIKEGKFNLEVIREYLNKIPFIVDDSRDKSVFVLTEDENGKQWYLKDRILSGRADKVKSIFPCKIVLYPPLNLSSNFF